MSESLTVAAEAPYKVSMLRDGTTRTYSADSYFDALVLADILCEYRRVTTVVAVNMLTKKEIFRWSIV